MRNLIVISIALTEVVLAYIIVKSALACPIFLHILTFIAFILFPITIITIIFIVKININVNFVILMTAECVTWVIGSSRDLLLTILGIKVSSHFKTIDVPVELFFVLLMNMIIVFTSMSCLCAKFNAFGSKKRGGS